VLFLERFQSPWYILISKEEEFGLDGLNMDEPITRAKARSKRFQELCKRLNSFMEEREEEVKIIYFNQLLE